MVKKPINIGFFAVFPAAVTLGVLYLMSRYVDGFWATPASVHKVESL